MSTKSAEATILKPDTSKEHLISMIKYHTEMAMSYNTLLEKELELEKAELATGDGGSVTKEIRKRLNLVVMFTNAAKNSMHIEKLIAAKKQ